MQEINHKNYSGERALFQGRDLRLEGCAFSDGESPLKESENIELKNCVFGWKYPLWYSKNIKLDECTFKDMARAGIWYTSDVDIINSVIESPKLFRRASGITLENVKFKSAAETLWSCKNVSLKSVNAVGGDYFLMNSEDIEIDGFELNGNYSFDGAKNVVIRNAKMLSKDAFWNSENVTVYDSYISGEYLGWNAKNLTLINCTVESLQGMCYIDNLVMKNCRLVNTTLAFEYSTVQADIVGTIDSVLNPSGGRITADGIGELIIEKDKVDPAKTKIILHGGTDK